MVACRKFIETRLKTIIFLYLNKFYYIETLLILQVFYSFFYRFLQLIKNSFKFYNILSKEMKKTRMQI